MWPRRVPFPIRVWYGQNHPNQFPQRLVEGAPTFAASTRRLSIGVTSAENGITYHVHLSEAEAKRFAAFVADRIELNPISP